MNQKLKKTNPGPLITVVCSIPAAYYLRGDFTSSSLAKTAFVPGATTLALVVEEGHQVLSERAGGCSIGILGILGILGSRHLFTTRVLCSSNSQYLFQESCRGLGGP